VPFDAYTEVEQAVGLRNATSRRCGVKNTPTWDEGHSRSSNFSPIERAYATSY